MGVKSRRNKRGSDEDMQSESLEERREIERQHRHRERKGEGVCKKARGIYTGRLGVEEDEGG